MYRLIIALMIVPTLVCMLAFFEPPTIDSTALKLKPPVEEKAPAPVPEPEPEIQEPTVMF